MNRIMGRLPKYYRKSVIMWGIAKAQEAALKECETDAERFNRELYIATAVDNLDRWEADLLLEKPPMIDDYEMWLNIRRANIIAKKTGYSACLKTLIETTAMLFTDEKVEVIIEPYWRSYILYLEFYKLGIPTLLTQMLEAVCEIKPAHMILDKDIQYRRWIDVLAACRTVWDRPEHTNTEVTGEINNPNTWNEPKKHTWRDVKEKEDILYENK